MGACAITGGIFAEAYNVLGGIDKVIPVDVYVPGCCPKPEAIIDGIIMAAARLDDPEAQKRHMEAQKALLELPDPAAPATEAASGEEVGAHVG